MLAICLIATLQPPSTVPRASRHTHACACTHSCSFAWGSPFAASGKEPLWVAAAAVSPHLSFPLPPLSLACIRLPPCRPSPLHLLAMALPHSCCCCHLSSSGLVKLWKGISLPSCSLPSGCRFLGLGTRPGGNQVSRYHYDMGHQLFQSQELPMEEPPPYLPHFFLPLFQNLQHMVSKAIPPTVMCPYLIGADWAAACACACEA